MKNKQIICGIYKIGFKNYNKFYIGSSVNINRRKYDHLKLLRKNKHQTPYLQHVFNKHKEDNIFFEIIYICDEQELPLKEQYYFDLYKPLLLNHNFIAGRPRLESIRKSITLKNYI